MNLFILIHLWFQESDREAFCRIKHHLHKYLHRKQTKVTRYNPIPAYQCLQILWLSVTTCFYWIPGYLVDCHKAAEVLFWMCCKPGAWLLLCRHKGQRNWSHSWKSDQLHLGMSGGSHSPDYAWSQPEGMDEGMGKWRQSLSTSIGVAETGHFTLSPSR